MSCRARNAAWRESPWHPYSCEQLGPSLEAAGQTEGGRAGFFGARERRFFCGRTGDGGVFLFPTFFTPGRMPAPPSLGRWRVPTGTPTLRHPHLGEQLGQSIAEAGEVGWGRAEVQRGGLPCGSVERKAFLTRDWWVFLFPIVSPEQFGNMMEYECMPKHVWDTLWLKFDPQSRLMFVWYEANMLLVQYGASRCALIRNPPCRRRSSIAGPWRDSKICWASCIQTPSSPSGIWQFFWRPKAHLQRRGLLS